jgi:tetratricopeptide (TPR) repeat protein
MQNFSNKDDNMALSKFESMLKSNKVYFFDSEEFEEIVYYYMDSGKLVLAKKAIELSLTQHPTSISLKLIKVELLIFENKLNEADKLLTYLEKIDATFDEIFIHKATILSKKNNHELAILELHKALVITNDLVDIHSLIGMEYLFLEDFTKAKYHFTKCIYIDNEDYAALYNIIYCFDMEEKYQEAITFLNDFIDENPYSEVAWHQLGRQYATLKNYNEAIRAFDYAILIDELFIGAYFEKGKALEMQQKYEEAISNYLITIELDDPTAYTYLQIASCYERLENNKFAIKYYHKAIQEDPMLDSAWLFLTQLYLKDDNTQKALYFIQKALEVDADNCDFLNRFAEINLKLNLFEESAKAFKKSIQLGDNRLEIYLALIDVLHFLGEYNDALSYLLQAKNLYADSVEVEYRLSGISFLLHKENDGIFYLENALKLDFTYRKVMQELYPMVYAKELVKHLIEKFLD